MSQADFGLLKIGSMRCGYGVLLKDDKKMPGVNHDGHTTRLNHFVGKCSARDS
jgi:hypothetical protein